jgi:putative Ca2+/H+ antiporter (TMEM165/GDT1 family)
MVAADALAIAAGVWLGRNLPERPIRYGAAALFAIFGLLLIVEGLR